MADEVVVKTMNVVTASMYVYNKWERDGSGGDMDLHSLMFGLRMALIADPSCKRWEDVVGAAHDLVHHVLSRWDPLDPAMPLHADAVVLLSLALADVGKYPGGGEGVSPEAVLAARNILWSAYETIAGSETGAQDVPEGGKGAGAQGEGESDPSAND